jgi:uncharacterized protein YbjT (DUF2867 family)
LDGLHAQNVVVVGGSGYVGRQICRVAVSRGHNVSSVNARGKPTSLEASDRQWADKVNWVQADVFHPDQWKHVITPGTVVVSSVGALGSAATM